MVAPRRWPAGAALFLIALLLAACLSSSDAALKKYKAAAVAKHKAPTNCWVIYNGYVYNLTKYFKSNAHPRGNAIMKPWCGKDMTRIFDASHGSSALSQLKKYRIGKLA
ncbi:hypothetical protein COHA_008223 [Chlorella ohadii]|uniref:Cytochrome b5 heme-binding domain-containing protein n=1 Tax=Chlorella ohadii TaxID=2649997 RepID=A0AAD5DKL0_9CHLO|nr:hypothetical protein COHA_008223 [Chlorella ohadii]